ncbi:GH3 auxin-responsive promoter family protein [Fusibacter bizertensis]|uniref:GH3 auxin-responsive promoter family protein n=1 Tax=Fusibacter bizertensis TaxID=1488331 RepID=A0ABT6NBR3_9FIRM|nr:GH3 auxin-responsive promoter family protein [Fusibacter bizertensis]MDH8677831.1 GH3 auxin-responsive promoter family protein [Fusibacter bizertensis]
MNLKKMLSEKQYDQIWSFYCGFLDLSLEQYMDIQKRLMIEQMNLWCASPLGKSILKGKNPKTLDEFRAMVPLTTYDDYADILLQKRADTLPDHPIIWIQTTWEGGKHPIKVAPYTRSMLDVYRTNVTACLILSTSTAKGKFDVEDTDKFLYGLAPLPYATGLFPLALSEEIDIEFLPEIKTAVEMTFSERNKAGFKLAMKNDVEFFFGLGSVAYAVSQSLSSMSSGGSGGLKSLLKCHPKMMYRILKAKYITKKEKRNLLPKDLFKLKGFMVAGTDNKCYKDDLEHMWGIRPMELFAGTEPSIIGTETWTRKGMYFFPDTCFYEFLLEKDMLKLMEEPTFKPRTYLMDEVVPGEKYEIVLTLLKGGAFARYRVGDMYRCVGLTNHEDGTKIPRFEYVDRVPTIIDIAGFTRISEHGIQSAIELSGLPVVAWTAKKEFSEDNRPFMHLYCEIEKDAFAHNAVSTDIIKEILTTYFKYIDQDYRDLKKILGMDPLKVTILRCQTFASFEKRYKKNITKVNPSHSDLIELLSVQNLQVAQEGGVE